MAPPDIERQTITIDQVRSFWQQNPLCSTVIDQPVGSREFFEIYDRLREEIEPPDVSRQLHEYGNFRGSKVLDIGCGNGYVLSRYAAEGADVYGVDITPAGIEACRSRFRLNGLVGDFRVADAQALPFEDGFFDCVCSMGVLHHVPDTAKALAQARRVLKPGGRLILMFYHRNSAKYQVLYRLRHLFTGKSMQQLVNEFDGIGNPRGDVYSRAELRKMLSDYEDVQLHVGYLHVGDLVPFGGRFLPANLFKPLAGLLGWNLYAKARKPL